MTTIFSSFSAVDSAATEILSLYSVDALQPLRLFMLSPDIVFAARLDMATIAYPLDSVTYDTVTTGAYTDILPGMTICFGSSAGLSDLGRQRIRKDCNASVLFVGRSSRGARDGEVTLTDNCYIAVYNDFRVWSKIPYITPAGVIYKDSDLPISDNTQNPPPVANCGPGFAATIDTDTELITVEFDGTASFATADGATITDYLWNVDDGTITVGTSADDTITATFELGFRWVSLTVTDSNDKTHTARCPVFARDPGAEVDRSIDDFQITEHRITPAGQTISFSIREDISDYPTGTLVMLWEGEPTDASDRSQMRFIGWHHTDPATIAANRTATLRDTVLNCLDVAGKLDTLPGFSQVFANDDIRPARIPSITWQYTTLPNINNFLHYLLHWHSTALELADWTWMTGGEDYVFPNLFSDGQSLHDQVNQRSRAMIPEHEFTCNRLGQLAITGDPMLVDTADRPATVQATLTTADYSDIRFTAQHFPRLHWLRGYADKVHLTVVSAFQCLAPGDTPGQGLEEQTSNYQLAITQDALNRSIGHRYARTNAPESAYGITLASGDDLGIEPAEMTWVELTIDSNVAAQRGLTFAEARGLVKEMSIRYSYEHTGTVKTVELQWERETVGYIAQTVIPVATEPIDSGGWTPPPIATVDEPPVGIPSGLQNVVMIDNFGRIFKTDDFQSSPPTWTLDTSVSASGLDAFSSRPFTSMIVDPFSPLYRGLGTTVNAYAVNKKYVYRIEDIFGVDGDPTIAIIYTFAYPTLEKRSTIMASFGRYFEDEATNPWLMVLSYYDLFATGHLPGAYVIYSKDAGVTWSSEINVGDGYDPDFAIGTIFHPGLYLSPKTPGLAYAVGWHEDGSDPYSADPRGYVSTDWGETWAAMSPALIAPLGNMGGVLHVPWPDNDDEEIVYYGAVNGGDGPALEFRTYQADGVSTNNLTPTVSGVTYGPWRYPFGIRTYDSNRQYVAFAGRGNSVDDIDQFSTNNQAAAFVSDDYGATWTNIITPIAANPNDQYPDSIAFSGDDPDVLYIWGNERFVAYSDDFGATIQDKENNIHALAGSGEETLLFAGGDTV